MMARWQLFPYRRSHTIQDEWQNRGENAMDRNSFDETLLTFKRRTPFRAFTVSLVNGDRVEVDVREKQWPLLILT